MPTHIHVLCYRSCSFPEFCRRPPPAVLWKAQSYGKLDISCVRIDEIDQRSGILEFQFLEDVMAVHFDRFERDAQVGGDLLGRKTLFYKIDNLHFPLRQCVDVW